MVHQSYTAVVERNRAWLGSFETEPYEAAWAREAIFFVRTLEAENLSADVEAHLQISPDGMHWCDEGTICSISAQPGLSFARVTHFGGWLRLAGRIPPHGSIKVIVYIVLKA